MLSSVERNRDEKRKTIRNIALDKLPVVFSGKKEKPYTKLNN